ncbi:dihydrosphingosine 1-phosphate phosphatase C823.11 [Aspergillus udagawae]|nr:dihydrosphingosine 1-phosphate phosphatase C823.11 [Aspergillus udagawae]
MAGVFATQQLEKVDETARDARMLPTDHAQSEIDNTLLDPMDTSSIKSSPAQQPETGAHPVSSIPPQNHIQTYSRLGPSFANPVPRYVATIDDPYPWGPMFGSPFVRPRFAFSPKSRAANRMKSNPIAVAKPSVNKTKQTSFAARNGSTFVGLNHTTHPFWNNRVVNGTSLLTVNMSSQGQAPKSDRSVSLLSGFPSLPRKRSIDEGATSKPTQEVLVDDNNIPVAPSAKYRRVDQRGSRSSPVLPDRTSPAMATGSQTGEACGNADSAPTATDNSEGNMSNHPGNANSSVTSSPKHKAVETLISEFRFQGLTSESQANIAEATTQPSGGNFPAHSRVSPSSCPRGPKTIGCPKPIDGPIRPLEVRGVIPQWHDSFPHGRMRIPGSWPEEFHFDPIANVRKGCNDSLQVTPLPISTAFQGSAFASPEHQDGQQIPWSWQETLYNARNSAVGRVVRKAFSYAWSTVTRLFKPSAGSSRRTATTVSTSPTRANLRNFPEQQRQQLKSHQWRKERGYPTVEHYPFPELSLDIPLYPAGATSQTESMVDVRRPSVLRKPTGTPRQPRKRIGTSGPRTVSLKEQEKRGKEKRARVESLSPRLKRRLLSSTRPSRWRSTRRERALAHALETTEHDTVRPLQPSAKALSINHIESRRSTLIQPRAPVEPKSKLKRVRFQEPLTETPAPTPPALLTELAPHLTPPSPKIDRVAQRTEQQIVEDKENVPPATEAAKKVELAARDDELRTRRDDWLRTEFPFGRPVSAVRLFYPVQKPLPPGRTESIYAAEWRKIEEEQKAKQKPTRVKPEGPAVRPLPPKWEMKISEIKSMPNNRQIATTLSGDPLTKKDLATCYTPMAWLNDEIINAYLALIVDYLRRSHGNAGRHDKPLFHAFNTFFFSNLRDKGYQSVRRWATRAKIGGEALLNVDTVFIPVHNSAHWTLIVVRPGERTIEHFDSLGSLSRRHVGLVQGWLRAELASRYVEQEWTVLPSISPQQDNGSDCGVFLLSTAKAVAVGLEPLSYGAKDIVVLRRKIVAELMNGGLDGDFDPTSGGGEPLL